MEIGKIKDALKEGGVEQSVIDAVLKLDQSAEVERLKGELEAEQGKGSGILADKKKYKERAEQAESKLKEIEDAKLPEAERQQKALQEMQEKLDAEKADREKQAADFAQAKREAALSDLTASVKWAEGTPTNTAKLIVKNAFDGVDDLTDKTKVDDVLKVVKESHKSFIAAEAPGGTGGKGGKGGNNNVGGANDASSIADNQKAIWGEK